MTDLSGQLLAHRKAAERSQPGFDAARFEAIAWKGGAQLCEVIGMGPRATQTLDAYLTLLVDAVSVARLGALTDALFGRAFVDDGATPASLAKAYNFADGFARDLPWLTRVAASEMSAGVSGVAPRLERMLRALFESSAGEWDSAPRVRRVSVREVDDGLLPGRIELLTPRLLRVVDRDEPDRSVGLAVLPGEPNTLHVTPPPPGPARPELAVEDKDLGGLPAKFGVPVVRQQLTSPAPFVAMLSDDSQFVFAVVPG